ncbi:dihydrofolate reductase [Candidatus Peribacteria bacterium]|nr:dihydrofolate reductase [Candidatus Peribacteria bacterium]
MIISMIVAADEHNVIGGHNALLWSLPADMQRMKALTMGHPLIMGRKTHESIGRALPGRRNIVITHQQGEYPGCEVVHSLEEALQSVKDEGEVFIFGGGEIYRQAMPMTQRIYMTRVHGKFDGDVFFPPIDPNEWKEVSREDRQKDEKNPYDYSFITYERVR